MEPGGGSVGSSSSASTRGMPMAIILEPSRELALQTERCIEDFSKYVSHPGVRRRFLTGSTLLYQI